MASSKKRVSYYYDPDIGNFYYGQVRARSAGTRSPRLAPANRGAGRLGAALGAEPSWFVAVAHPPRARRGTR